MTMTTSGICRRTLAGMKYVFEDREKISRFSTICIDGMKIQSGLFYMNNDKINGFEEVEDGRTTSNIANELIVIMAQGLAERWRQVCNRNNLYSYHTR